MFVSVPVLLQSSLERWALKKRLPPHFLPTLALLGTFSNPPPQTQGWKNIQAAFTILFFCVGVWSPPVALSLIFLHLAQNSLSNPCLEALRLFRRFLWSVTAFMVPSPPFTQIKPRAPSRGSGAPSAHFPSPAVKGIPPLLRHFLVIYRRRPEVNYLPLDIDSR